MTALKNTGMKKYNVLSICTGLLMTMVPAFSNSTFECDVRRLKNDVSNLKFGNLKIRFYF
jgi:hypothetical protein